MGETSSNEEDHYIKLAELASKGHVSLHAKAFKGISPQYADDLTEEERRKAGVDLMKSAPQVYRKLALFAKKDEAAQERAKKRIEEFCKAG